MKTKKIVITLLLLYGFVNGQYIIKQSAFSNGAAIHSGSEYTLKGLAGQHLTGKSANDIFIVSSGFVPFMSLLVTALNDPFSDLPGSFELFQNYPNPFNPATTIKYALPEASRVQIDLYNVLGQNVASLENSQKAAGFHMVHFNANQLPSGMYFYTIRAGSFKKVMRMMLVK
jgi:hypothetical protein